MKIGILNLSRQELTAAFVENDIAKFRANQVYDWLYKFGKRSFKEMPNIGAALQNKLTEVFYIYRPTIKEAKEAKDGTIKFLLELADQNRIETVFIPEAAVFVPEKTAKISNKRHWKRATICISSQVGCAVGCLFCNTGYAGFIRNLSVEEITTQLFAIKDYLNLWQNEDRISNIVFMGMGEPLYNSQTVLKAINNMTTGCCAISKRKITISTSGIANVLLKIAKDIQCKLAISLHAPNNTLRSSIMPINKIYNIENIIKACKEYSLHNNLCITFEYLLLADKNDSESCAKELLAVLRPLNSKVNLIQFNPWPGCNFSPSTFAKAEIFAKILENGGIKTTIRKKRGEEIMAACGQLSFR